MHGKPNPTLFIFAAVATMLYSSVMALAGLVRLICALGGLILSLAHLTRISVSERTGK